MLFIQRAPIKSEQIPSQTPLEPITKVAKSKPKTTKRKALDSNKLAATNKTSYKVESSFTISKRMATHYATKLNSIDTIPKYNKNKLQVSKPISEEQNNKFKNGFAMDKTLALESKKVVRKSHMRSTSNISKTKQHTVETDNLIVPSENKKRANSKLGSKKSKSLSSEDIITKNPTTKHNIHSKYGIASIKRAIGNKNDYEKSSQGSSRSENKVIKRNRNMPPTLKLTSPLNDKSNPKLSQKDVKHDTKPTDNINNKVPVKDEPKQKSPIDIAKHIISDNTSTYKVEAPARISSSFRRHAYAKHAFTTLPMHRRINSLELMNKVYPRVEITTDFRSNYSHSDNNRTKSDILPKKLHSDNGSQLRLKYKTCFDSKKPSSAPEPRKRSGRVHKLSPVSKSKHSESTKSLNGSKLSTGSLPKWQVQKLSNVAKEPENDLMALKSICEAAKAKHKTFTCCGGYKSIKTALEARGWIERINIYQSGYDDLTRQLYKQPMSDLLHGIHDRNTGVSHRRVIMSKLLGSHQVDLYWDYSHDVYHGNPDSVKLTIINSIQRGVYSYATKHGLCESSKEAYWYHKPGKCHLRHPRSYSVTSSVKPDDFIRDFKITACLSLLKWIVEMPRIKSVRLTSDQGKIAIQHFQFAVKESMKFLRRLKHEDIDKTIPESPDKDWNGFLDAYSEAVHRGNHFKTNIHEAESTIIHKSNVILDKLRKCWPYCDMDGSMNIWILKPSYGSRGIGIHICRTLPYIMRILNENKNYTYVIQKYIERPLLIFNTKFDIRQWFLISSTSPLTIWIYKDCYLRFSSQTYNLRKLHESIHLTNNSVQSRYHNTVNRDPSIPEYNMWELETFKQHLMNIGYAGVFEKIIYPGMKECITAAILMNQEHLNKRKNSFQLHGADFMLTEDFIPWLIEINARPALYSSTPVTARMCPRVLTDTIRVVIDYKENPNASTGAFELLYKERIEKLPNTIYDPNMFIIQGHAIRKDYFQTPEQAIAEGNLCNSKKSSEIMDITNNKNFILQVGKEMRTTLEQLLSLIHNEKNRRKMLKNQLSDTTSLNKEELKELYKKEDFDSLLGHVQGQSSMGLQHVLYNSLSSNVLNSLSKDAKQLHGMISKELGKTCALPNINTIEEHANETIQKQISSQSTYHIDASTLSSEEKDEDSVKCYQDIEGVTPTGGIFNNFLGMISSLSFN